MERVKSALTKHYHRDPLAFLLEMFGMMFTIAGSLIMAVTAKNPDLTIIYPLFLIGSATGFVAYYRLQMIWSVVLTGYFVIINIIGFIIAFN